MFNAATLSRTIARYTMAALLVAAGGCSATQMRYNVLSYNDAVAESSNQLLLLNAVRASQRYPMSFTSTGTVAAVPTIAGSFEGTFNFDPFGLTSYTLSPKAATSGGYNSLTLDNLNYDDFVKRSRDSIPYELVQYFDLSDWPRELLVAVFVQRYALTQQKLIQLHHHRQAKCAEAATERERQICGRLQQDLDDYNRDCDDHFADIKTRLRQSLYMRNHQYFNTARNFCSFLKFQIFARELRLVDRDGLLPPAKVLAGGIGAQYRSVQGMIYFLGEMIAAQNYLEKPFVPTVYIGGTSATGSIDRITVPLFVVRRNDPDAIAAAVIVRHEREIFYIPRPDYGSPTEARSLQVLDLVNQAMTAVTGKGDIPKLQPLGLYAPR